MNSCSNGERRKKSRCVIYVVQIRKAVPSYPRGSAQRNVNVYSRLQLADLCAHIDTSAPVEVEFAVS